MRSEVRPRPTEPSSSSRPVLAVGSRAARRGSYVLLVASLLASFGVAEVGLRLLRYRPWGHGASRTDEPALHEPDSILGWVNKPGHYVLPPYVPGDSEREVTILADHSRTVGGLSAGGGRVVFLGCSVTAGYGLSDADTFAWKLQHAHPQLHFANYGTAAYSTLQSLLRMEQLLARSPPPRLVLYGFITQHEARNVATYDWLRGLALTASRGHRAPPYVTLRAGNTLERHPPEAFSVWPLADHLVAVRVADDAYMHLVTYGRTSHAAQATKRLLLEMTALARSHSMPFGVVFLLAEEEKKREYVDFFRENDVPYVDCVQPLSEKNRIPGEGHPNGQLNSVWAQCISDKLPDLLPGTPR